MRIMRLKGISKKYALRAAHYRRVARTLSSELDFSEKALRELHAWESSGVGGVDKAKNGYAYGKWLVDLNTSMWIEDIQAGHACKAEFLSTPLERLHNTSKLGGVVAGVFFAWEKS